MTKEAEVTTSRETFKGDGMEVTAFVARPTEYGPHQKYDFEAKGDWDIVAKDFGGIADRLGC